MSKHKKSHIHAPSRREQCEPTPARRASISPTVLMLTLSILFGGVLVYLIASGNPASSQVAITEIAGAGSDVSLPIATFADGVARIVHVQDGRVLDGEIAPVVLSA